MLKLSTYEVKKNAAKTFYFGSFFSDKDYILLILLQVLLFVLTLNILSLL